MTSERAVDGWEELRREIETLRVRYAGWVPVDQVLAIVDRLAAARGEPGLDAGEAAAREFVESITVYEKPDVDALLAKLRDRFHEARAGTPEWRDGIRLGLEIAMNEVGYWATPTTPEPDPKWPTLADLRRMTPAEVNRFLESIGSDLRVVEPPDVDAIDEEQLARALHRLGFDLRTRPTDSRPFEAVATSRRIDAHALILAIRATPTTPEPGDER